MKGFFITGTDTGVGKTLVSAILTSVLNASYWKPIQSGIEDEMSDVERVRQLTNLPAQYFPPSRYLFRASLSPDQAAEREGITINLDQCVLPTPEWRGRVGATGGRPLQTAKMPIYEEGDRRSPLRGLAIPVGDTLIVEGAGGVYVPLNPTQTMLDLMKKFALPIIVVARGTLGTINHTLLTIDVLRRHSLQIHGIIFNGDLNPDNQRAIEQRGQVRTLFHVPRLDRINCSVLEKWLDENKPSLLNTWDNHDYAHTT